MWSIWPLWAWAPSPALPAGEGGGEGTDLFEGRDDPRAFSEKNLGKALKKLHTEGVIEGRLYEWAEALRGDGNLAAHDPKARISREDATDLVDFAEALLDAVLVLHERFEGYKKRWAECGKEEKKMTKGEASGLAQSPKPSRGRRNSG